MLTSEIENELKDIKNFLGVFPLDRIPQLTSNCSCVINTDPSNKPGQHWVSILVQNDFGFYFDSFGLPPLQKEFITSLNKHCVKGWTYNPTTLQSFNGITCGHYCIMYIKLRQKMLTHCEIIKMFTKEKIVNDILVKNLIKFL